MLWVGGIILCGVDWIDNVVVVGFIVVSLVLGFLVGLGSMFIGDWVCIGDVWWGDYGGVWCQCGSYFLCFLLFMGMKKDWVWEVMFSGGDGQFWVGYGDDGLWCIDGDGSWQ